MQLAAGVTVFLKCYNGDGPDDSIIDYSIRDKKRGAPCINYVGRQYQTQLIEGVSLFMIIEHINRNIMTVIEIQTYSTL